MNYYYGDKNILRALEEAEFWKHQETEHTQLVKAIIPDLESTYVNELNNFEKEFNKIRGYLVRFIESEIRSAGTEDVTKAINCIEDSIEQSNKFIDFLEKVMEKSRSKHLDKLTKEVINHIIRESHYSIGIEELIL